MPLLDPSLAPTPSKAATSPISDLFRKKVATYDTGDAGMKRVLSAADLTMLGIGSIVGTGIFVLTGEAAATQGGPGIVLSFLLAGLTCTFAALAYAELAASIGGCGSAYTYSYAAFGELIAWIIAWDLILEYGVSVAAVADGWSGYFNNALTAVGIGFPDQLTKGPFAGGLVNLPAIIVILLLMLLLVTGVKETARINAAGVIIKLIAIAIFIGVALFNLHPENWSPFLPFGWFEHNADGKPVGVLAGAALVFFAYIGIDTASTAVEEARNPQRDVPIGILAALAICTTLYVIVALLMTGIVPYASLNVASPASHALLAIGQSTAAGLVAGGVIFGLTTVMLVTYYGQTRIITGVARDGLLPAYFGAVHPRTQTPVRATVVTGVAVALMAGFIPLGVLAELVNIGTLVAFILVCGGVIVLRRTHPDMPRPFKVPFGTIIPWLGILSCAALVGFLPYETHLRFIVWLAAGLIIYFGYSVKHSRLANNAP
jgi:basic amino acid/polyamine antiporter, APA family